MEAPQLGDRSGAQLHNLPHVPVGSCLGRLLRRGLLKSRKEILCGHKGVIGLDHSGNLLAFC